MAGMGLNPRYGWDGDAFNFACDHPPAYDGGFLPPAPPGYAWFDMGSAAPYAPPAAMPWGMPGAAPSPIWAQWNQYTTQWGGAASFADPSAAFPGTSFHMEPGYGYIFPVGHCKIHVISSPSPPWLNAGPYEKKCFNVPTNITVKELMQQFGCTNADAKRNRLVELTQGSEGTWYKGIEVLGSEEKKMAKRIDEIGWNVKRNGIDADFVWLWFAK